MDYWILWSLASHAEATQLTFPFLAMTHACKALIHFLSLIAFIACLYFPVQAWVIIEHEQACQYSSSSLAGFTEEEELLRAWGRVFPCSLEMLLSNRILPPWTSLAPSSHDEQIDALRRRDHCCATH
jgi:hypothetical protein